MSNDSIKTNPVIETLFKAGAHFGLIRSRRHPSAKPYLYGQKNKVEIFDLEKTHESLETAKRFIQDVVANSGLVLFVGGKNEARQSVQAAAIKAGMPFVAGRWLGGTLTNFPEIKKRINRLEDLLSQREKGELGKYTKKERLLIDREIIRLQDSFSGLVPMKGLPKVVFVVDSRREDIAVKEAHKLHIPVVALASSDCDIRSIEYPIPGNDASVASIQFFVNEIVSAVQEGKKTELTKKTEPKETKTEGKE